MKEYPVSLFIPIYNFTPELVIKNVKIIREFAEKHYRGFEIILVDDASRAETKSAIEEAGRLGRIRVIRYENGPSRRENLAASFAHAKYDILVFLDVDLSTDISYLLPLTESVRRGWDIAIGSRYMGIQARRERSRFVMSKMYNAGVRAIFGSQIKDHTCGCKAFRKNSIISLIQELGYDHAKRRGWFWDAEMLIRARRRRMRVEEIPVAWASDRESTFSFSREARVIPYMISFWVRGFL